MKIEPDISGLHVAVAMSGGVDSSLAATLLLQQGCRVTGLFVRLPPENDASSAAEIEQVRDVANHLGISLEILDLRKIFQKQIIDHFLQEYACGCTPSPCVRCNQLIKFGLFWKHAQAFGADRLATGHYARLEARSDGKHLLAALDHRKDQSYFLHRLSQKQLEPVIFPLGEINKSDVRRQANELELPLDTDSESQDLCFINDGEQSSFLKTNITDSSLAGDIKDLHGQRLAGHNGIQYYTVGQRKGLGLATGVPMYVVRIDPHTHTIYVGTRDESQTLECEVQDVSWVAGHQPEMPLECTVRIRYRHTAAQAMVTVAEQNSLRVKFSTPQFAVAPGQAAVFYHGDEVLGGGWLAQSPLPEI